MFGVSSQLCERKPNTFLIPVSALRPFLAAHPCHPTLLGLYGLENLCRGHCSANVLQDGGTKRVKEAAVPEGGDQAAAARGCEGLGYLLAARAHRLLSWLPGTTWVASAALRGIS